MKYLLLALLLNSCLCLTPVASQQQQQYSIASLSSKLPQPLGYWPLNKKFGPQDASPNHLNGVFRSAKVEPVEGPFGVADSAYSFGADDRAYLEFAKPEFNLGNSSFTVSMFVKIHDARARKVAPLLEFPMNPPSTAAYGLNIWMWPDSNHLMISATNTGDPLQLPCSFEDWAFVGAIYDNVTKSIQSFCNTTVSPRQSFADSPLTADAGFIVGKSLAIPGKRAAVFTAGRVAGLSIYKQALKRPDIVNIYRLYSRYVEEPCQSSLCIPETCQLSGASTANSTKFECRCETTGENNEECAKPTMSTKAEEMPATTMAPEDTTMMPEEPTTVVEEQKEKLLMEQCGPGLTGEKCDTPMCDPVCTNGTYCSAPNTCSPQTESSQVIAGLERKYWIIIIIAVIVLIIVAIVVGVCCCKKKKTEEQGHDGPEGVPLRAAP